MTTIKSQNRKNDKARCRAITEKTHSRCKRTKKGDKFCKQHSGKGYIGYNW